MKEDFLSYLKLVAKTLQTNYDSTSECKAAIRDLLKTTSKKYNEIAGESMYESKWILEHITSPNMPPKIKD
jgi:hypothetical protein